MAIDGAQLRRFRKAAGDSQDEAARRCKMSLGYYNRIENGFIEEVRDNEKRKALQGYISSARQRAQHNLKKAMEALN